MRSARRALAAALAGLTLGAAGCTGTSASESSASPAVASPSEPAAPSASSSPSAGASTQPTPSPLATLAAEQCLSGSWDLVRFVATQGQTYGTGEGGDVTVRFRDGAYELAGAGRKPMTITLAGTTAQLKVDGRAEGSYTLAGTTATFRSGTARGSGTVKVRGRTERLSMDQVTSVVGLQGDGQVACTPEAMTITLNAIRLELGRA